MVVMHDVREKQTALSQTPANRWLAQSTFAIQSILRLVRVNFIRLEDLLHDT